jgi:hypothetical protein
MINKYVVTYGIYLYFDVEITQFNRNISFLFGENLNISCIHISHLYHYYIKIIQFKKVCRFWYYKMASLRQLLTIIIF